MSATKEPKDGFMSRYEFDEACQVIERLASDTMRIKVRGDVSTSQSSVCLDSCELTQDAILFRKA